MGLVLTVAAVGCSILGNVVNGSGDTQTGEVGGTGGDTAADTGTEAGSDAGQAVPVASDGRPAAPSNLDADHVAIWNINVSWADNSDNEDGFRIYRQRLDVLGSILLAGEAGENATLFYDTDTLCGATYKYIVASYNEIGESPASACWVITLPPCTAEQLVDMPIGSGQGYDFVSRNPASPGDFTLGFGPDSRLLIMSDQEGQNGAMDLGFLGDWPLNRVDPPPDGAYTKDGVPVVVGNTYLALARDGTSVIVFRVEELASTVQVRALVWYDADLIDSEACEGPPGLTLTGGGPCISGDDICDPFCSTPSQEVIGTPATDESGMVREVLTLVEETGGDGNSDTQIQFNPVYQECADLAHAMLSNPPTPAELAAAQAAFLACLESHGVPPIPTDSRSVVVLRRLDGDGTEPDNPTFTPRDYDCDDNLCVPGDDICDPICRDVPEGYEILEEQIDVEGGMQLIALEPADGESTLVVDRGDIDCDPGRPNFQRYCGPEKPAAISASFTLWVQQDRNGDGDMDYFIYVDADPASPTYGTVIEWDMLCRDPNKRYICDPERPAEVAEGYELVSANDTNGDGVNDYYVFVNTDPTSPHFGDYLIWDRICPEDELICSPRKPPAINSDYEPIEALDTNGDGMDDRFWYVNVNPASPDYGKIIIWDMICDQPERRYWCGPNEPDWLTDDYEVAESGLTYTIFVNTNPSSPDFGDIIYWDFGPNCPGDETPPPPEDPCEEHGGLGWEGDTCVCEGIIVHVTICQDQTQTEVVTEIPCEPDPSCFPDDEPDDECTCEYVCIEPSSVTPGCAKYGYRDSCTGATCRP
jgi:hypothetical protein